MFTLLFFVFITFSSCSANALTNSVHYDEICGEFNGRRLYLDLGESGTLVARNMSQEWRKLVWQQENNDKRGRCSLEIVTCSSCLISIQFNFLNLTDRCGKYTEANNCWCDYVWIFEPPYENASEDQFCGRFIETSNSTLLYRSQTRSVAVRFFYSSSYQHAFTLKYFSRRNRYFINGSPDDRESNGTELYFTSPFFPNNYPSDASIEYVINCKSVALCRVQLMFSDFQISRSSLMEFFDWNGQRIFATTGIVFRPPILLSSGPSIVVRFYGNGGTNLGYKVYYSFLMQDQFNATRGVNTDCGGYVDNLGGGITMMSMVQEGTVSYNCFWIIRPPLTYLNLKTQLYAKITKFENFIGTAELTIRQGSTTNSPVVEKLHYPVEQFSLRKIKEHIVPINEGFYVSLRGTFSAESKLEIVYAAFGYKDCSTVSNFLCNNQRCISTLLRCDEFDHCGDNSDEPDSCLRDEAIFHRTRTPNFYFRKDDKYFDLKTATIVFVVSSLALISLILSLIILLYRLNIRGNNHRQLQNRLQAINDLLAESTSRYEEEEIIIDDNPPMYEPPPDYIDLFKGDTLDRRFLKKCSVKKSSRRNSNHRVEENRDINDRDSANTSTAGSTLNLLSVNTNTNCQTTPTPSTIAVPDAPPPAYESVTSCKSQTVCNIEAATQNIIDFLNIDLPHLELGAFTNWLQNDRRTFPTFPRSKSGRKIMPRLSRLLSLSDSELFNMETNATVDK